MKSIDDVHIRRLDMTLLLVFDGLMRTGKMSTVAAELGLTQSAVSHAVGRLRQVFGDPLFERRGAGVAPTARARQLSALIAEAVGAVREALRFGRTFDPGTAVRTFTIAALDSIIASVAPTILANLAGTAPHCRIIFRTFGRADAEAAVLRGTVDLALGVFPQPPPETFMTFAYAEDYLCAARRGHPALTELLDVDRYCALDHVLVSPSGEAYGTFDAALERIGRTRRIAAVMPQFMIAFAAVAKSDAIVTAPSRVCLELGSSFGLEVFAPPIAVPGFEVGLLRHQTGQEDPALTWLAELIVSTLESRMSGPICRLVPRATGPA